MKSGKSRLWSGRKFTCYVVLLAMLFSLGGIMNPTLAYAAHDTESPPATSLTIKVGTATGNYTTLRTFSDEEMAARATRQQMYSYFDSLPTPVMSAGTGVYLSDLLDEVGIDLNDVERFYFYTTDWTSGPFKNLTKEFLYDTPRYYFPLIAESWDAAEGKPAASGTWGDDPTAGKVPVEPMLAVKDDWRRVLDYGVPDFDTQDTSTRFRLMTGQSEAEYLNATATAPNSAKWVHEIDVKLTSAAVTGVTLNRSAFTLAPGESGQLTATVTPSYASDPSVSWSSDNLSVATVDANGLVTAVTGGSAVITVTTADGDFTATCAVTVEASAAPTWPNRTMTYSDLSQSGVTLSWSGVDDNVEVTGYKVYKDGTLLTAVPASETSYTVTGLNPDTEYVFIVQAVNAAGNESTDGPSVPVRTLVSTVSVTLELTKYTAQPGDSVTASGTADANTWVSIKVLDSAQSVIVYDAVRSGAGGNYSCAFKVPLTAPGSLTVVAGYGSNVDNKTITVDTTPGGDTTAPTWPDKELSYSDVSQSGVTLSWSGAHDNVEVTGYKVYKDGTLLITVPASETSYTVTDLSPDTEYTFSVQAVDAAGNESTDGPSVPVRTLVSIVSVTLELSKYTAQPGDSVTASGKADVNTWVSIKVLDNGQSVIFFDAVRSDAEGDYSCTFKVPGTAEGTLKVVAGYGVNVDNKAITVDTTPGGDTIAPTWTNGTLNASNVSRTRLTLSWSGASDDVGVTGYKVYQGTTLLTASPVSGDSYTVTGLSQGTEYTFTVQAVDAAGNESADGPSVTVTTAVPITDENVAVTENNKHLAVTAETPGEVNITVPAGITGATIDVSELLGEPDENGRVSAELPALTIAADDPDSDGTIQVSIPAGTTVSAPAGWDGTINVPTVQPKDSATATPGATVESVIEIGYGDVLLIFDRAVRLLIPGQAGKDVGYVRGGVFTEITTILSADTQEAGDALDPGADGKIDADNDLAVWTKHFTKFVTYTQKDTTAPSWSEGKSLTATDVTQSSLTLTWSGADDNVGVTGYNVYQGTAKLNASPVSGNSYSVTGLSAGTRYTFTVQAVDAAGNESTNGPSVTETTLGGGSGGGGGGGGGGPSPVTSTTGTAMVPPSAGGTISLGEEATIVIPANALQGTRTVEVKVQKVDQPPAAPAGFRLAGAVYEFTVGGAESYSFAKKVTIKISFDPDLIGEGETPTLQYYDQAQAKWVDIGGSVSGNLVTAQVDHFTKFAVMAAVEAGEEPPQVPGEAFTDIAGHWAESNISELVSLGAIAGYPDGTFRPDSSITRAEFATVLTKAFKLAPQDGKVFADTAGHWARDYIAAAAAGGIVSGYDDTTFGPDHLITREQMAVMIVKAAGLSPAAGETSFADSGSISVWAREAVAAAVENGIISGYPDNTVRPLGNATRAEAVTVIVKALDI